MIKYLFFVFSLSIFYSQNISTSNFFNVVDNFVKNNKVDLEIKKIISRYNSNKIRILKNSIYAYKGYKFSNDTLVSFFKKFDWYKPLSKEIKLNKFDYVKLDFIEHIDDFRLLYKLSGVWINSNYLESLEETKSPYKSKDITRWVLMNFNLGDSIHNITNIYNFHDGDGFDFKNLNEHYDLFYSFIDKNGNEIKKFDFELYNDSTINFSTNNIFVKRSNLYEYINSIILTGKYMDQDGNSYTFYSDGRLDWNGKILNYSIGLNHVFSQTDYIRILNETDGEFPLRYGFEISQNKLLLFKAFYEEGIPEIQKQAKPFLKLSKMVE